MKVASIMTEKPLKVRMDDSIGTIREILENVEFHHLLVIEGRKLVGIMSDRDVLKAISPFLGTLSEKSRGEAIPNKRVHLIMTVRLQKIWHTWVLELVETFGFLPRLTAFRRAKV